MAGNFYAIFPHNLLVLMFGSVFGWSVLALALGVRRFWRETNPAPATLAGSTGARTSLPDPVGQALAEATGNALTLKYLDGGTGEGCNDQDDRPTLLRRTFHHFTFYGFLLCFASTSIATVYHYGFGWQAPYALTSLPVILGTVGGVGLLKIGRAHV